MRRGSIIAPLILILIGGLFLINNLRPETPVLRIISQTWPFLLIGWGLLRLIEIFVWAAQGKPLPRTGISGGEWAVVALICLIGTGTILASHTMGRWGPGRINIKGIEIFGEPFDYALSEQKACGKTPRILIDNLRGNARVIGADVSEVKLTGTKTIKAMAQMDADRAHRSSPLDVQVQGDQVMIRTNQERTDLGQRMEVNLEITVPRGATIEARGRYGDFDITDVDGAVEVVSDNAGVRLQNIGGTIRTDLRRSDIVRIVNAKGNVEVKSGRGDELELENINGTTVVTGEFSGDMKFRQLAKALRIENSKTMFRVEKIPGEVRLALGDLTGSNLVGPIELRAKSKDVQLSGFSDQVDIRLDRGDVELRAEKLPVSKIDVLTKSGNIDLAMPNGAKIDLKAVSERGSVNNNYGAPFASTDNSNDNERGQRLIGKSGVGPAVSLVTERGEVNLRRTVDVAEHPAMPAAPPKPPKAPQAAEVSLQ